MPFGNNQAYPFTALGIATYAPASFGVYGIHNQQNWIYIGESENIQARLYHHLSGQSDQSQCILGHGATHFTYELGAANYRILRETALRHELGGYCNAQ